MRPFRVKATGVFLYSPDGIRAETKVPGEVFDARADLLTGLLAEGKVEQTDEDLTAPEELARLRALYANPSLLGGVTPAVVGLARASHHTDVEDEHSEPVRRRAAEELGPARAAAAVARPNNPPPTADRAARDAAEATGKSEDELRTGTSQKGAVGAGNGTYETKDVRAAPKQAVGPGAKVVKDEKDEKAAAKK